MEKIYYSNLLKHFILLFSVLCFTETFAQSNNPAPYCYPTTGAMFTGTCTNSYGFNITSVKLNTLSQSSGCFGTADSDVYRFWSNTTNLIAGSTYTMEIMTAQSSYNYNVSAGFWIDYDQDSTFDSVELVGAKMSKNNVIGGIIHTITFTVPCNALAGTTRMRVKSQGLYMINGAHACGFSSYFYGENWDFPITIVQPTSVSADFSLATTAYNKTNVKFTNTNRIGYISHTWDANNDGTIESANSIDFTYKWITTGTKCIKLRSTNCYGTDSVLKCFSNIAPVAVPVGDFTSCSRVIEQYSSVQLFDKSTNGPWEWVWDVYDSSENVWATLSGGEIQADPYNRGNDEFSPNPEFQFDFPGNYTVVLTSKNDIGSSKRLVRKYSIIVNQTNNYYLGFGVYGIRKDNRVTSNYGSIIDNGGPSLNYGNNNNATSKSYLAIVPDAQTPVTIKFHQLKFADTNDYVMVYDDDTANGGQLIAKLTSTDNGTTPSFTSTSNMMYVTFTSNSTGVDSGFYATYSAAGYGDTYKPLEIDHSLTLTGLKVFNKHRDIAYLNSYQKWTVDDVHLNAFNGIDTLRYTFTDTATHKFCLEVSSCDSTKKVCKYIAFNIGVLGTIYNDLNSNCVRDSSDTPLGNIMLKLYDSSSNLLGQSSANAGAYNFNVNTGTYTVAIDTASIPYQVSCTYPGVDSTFTLTNGSPVAKVDFNIQCKSGFDIGVQSVAPMGAVFPGIVHYLKILAGDLSQWYGLECANGVSGLVKITITGPVTYNGKIYNSLTPSISGNTYSYTISDFSNINNKTAFGLMFSTDTSANMNDTILVSVEVTPISGDNDSSNNKKEFRYLVSNSYDPNMKDVYPVDVPPLFNDWFTYTVHFQNTGNAAAHNIRIADTLASQFDLSTFQVLNYSHTLTTTVRGNALSFRFPNIMLPDSFSDSKGSQGFVQYRVKPNSGLPKGTMIYNTAFIYFDYNAPIVTNTTVNHFVENSSSIADIKALYALNIYPNPFQNIFNLKLPAGLENTAMKVRIYNVLGELVFESDLNGTNMQINLSNQPNGIYIVRVEGEEIALNACIVKQ